MNIKLFTLVSDLRSKITNIEHNIYNLKKNYPKESNEYLDLDNIEDFMDSISATYDLLLQQLDALVSVQVNAIHNNKD